MTSGDGDLLTIGSFALLSGLSIPALRHYDDAGVLLPADVDAATSYRRYRRQQLPLARAIRLLRSVDLPLAEVVSFLRSFDDATLHDLLLAHRDRLKSRADDIAQLLTRTDQLLEKGVTMTDLTTTARVAEVSLYVTDADRAAAFYRDVFDVEFATDEHGGPEHYHASFGSWPGDDFFMFTVWPASAGTESTTHMGFVVQDLDATWARAIKAGADAVAPPADTGGMPRNARFRDTGGNHIILYQA